MYYWCYVNDECYDDFDVVVYDVNDDYNVVMLWC